MSTYVDRIEAEMSFQHSDKNITCVKKIPCPNCGVIDFAKSNRCPYCDAELSKYLANWVLDDVKQIA